MMKGSGHDKICFVDNVDQVRSLSADATVSCAKCGAKAHDPADVCDPVQLPEVGTLGD